jgi:integrase
VIYKRGGKGWYYDFRWTIKDADGAKEHFRVKRSAKTKSKAAARAVEEEHRRALRLGSVHPLDPWPVVTAAAAPVFRAFSKEFLRHAEINTKPGSHTFYGDCVMRLLNFAKLADARLDTITGDLVSAYCRYRLEVAKNCVVTVNGDLRTLRRLLNLAAEWGRIDRAPVIHELPQAEGRDRVVSFAEEARYLAAASKNLKDAAILAVDTGVRPDSELFVLCWPNVELTALAESPNGVIHIHGGKSEAAKRSVPLTPRAAEVLLGRKREAEAKPKRSPYVFPGDGNTGHVVSMQHPHENAIRDAGLTSFPFYTWRHTFGTRSAQSGMDRYSLARLMGHSSPSVTARYYVHVQEPHVAAGFAKFVEYQAHGIAEGIAAAFPEVSDAVQ